MDALARRRGAGRGPAAFPETVVAPRGGREASERRAESPERRAGAGGGTPSSRGIGPEMAAADSRFSRHRYRGSGLYPDRSARAAERRRSATGALPDFDRAAI